MSETEQSKKPVQVSGDATLALARKVREWSGWADARVLFGKPPWGSRYATTDHTNHTIIANPDLLVLNPNRVLNSVTPFRLRQEGVLTGALLHESAHARYTHWKPRTVEQVESFVHSDGTPVTKQEFALANLTEEARIEGLMYRDADSVGATGLGWTLKANAVHVVPLTELSDEHDQQIMDVIESWVLRAGRRYSMYMANGYGTTLPHWVHSYNALLFDVFKAHLTDSVGLDSVAAEPEARAAQTLLMRMAAWDGEMAGYIDHTGPYLVDAARDLLAILFPETHGDDDAPMPSAGCSMPMPSDDDDSEDEQESDESDEQESGEGESDDEADEPGEGDEDDEDDESESDDESDEDGDDGDEADDDGEADDGDEADDEADGEADGEAGGATDSTATEALAAQLASIEAEADNAGEQEASAEKQQAAKGAGSGPGAALDNSGWHNPTLEDREVQKKAARFLRDVIEPSESSQVTLSETPAATVDGAALSAWKAGGQVRSPHFFRLTRRNVEPSPPVRIAVLVDVSASMEQLQGPSSTLSWALSAAAFDLRNFAGRGQQVESCLIHWGSRARVIQKNGEMMPGIRHFGCNENTSAMHSAMELVEQEMPGFFDITEKPVNRLLVQFTDWILGYSTVKPSTAYLSRAMEAGVNMLSVVPSDYREDDSGYYGSSLPMVLAGCPIQRGRSTVLKYNPKKPDEVWTEASRALSG